MTWMAIVVVNMTPSVIKPGGHRLDGSTVHHQARSSVHRID